MPRIRIVHVRLRSFWFAFTQDGSRVHYKVVGRFNLPYFTPGSGHLGRHKHCCIFNEAKVVKSIIFYAYDVLSRRRWKNRHRF